LRFKTQERYHCQFILTSNSIFKLCHDFAGPKMSYRGDESRNFLKIGSFTKKKDSKTCFIIYIYYFSFKTKPKNRAEFYFSQRDYILQRKPNWGVLLTLNSLTFHRFLFRFGGNPIFLKPKKKKNLSFLHSHRNNQKKKGFLFFLTLKKWISDFNLIKNFFQRPF